MKEIVVVLPKMGESVAEATIIKWLKKEGETVKSDDSLVEIATDKVDSEVPSPADGIISKIMFKEGEVAKVGEVICTLTSNKEAVNHFEEIPTTTEKHKIPDILTPVAIHEKKNNLNHPAAETPAIPSRHKASNTFYSPLVKSIVLQEKIELSELETITGTGSKGRITKKDIFEYLSNRNSPLDTTISTNEPHSVSALQKENKTTALIADKNNNCEIVEMDRMRKIIAEHMVMSKHTSPHVTSFVEADVTNLVKWRDRIKRDFEKKENEKITFTPLFIEAVIKAIHDLPMINISVEGTKIIIKKNINIGMATALPNGNLIVPVIKNADRLSLIGLTKTVNDLAVRARTNKLIPDEIQEGTFTITNIGTFGNVMGTPIINQPQVAILATGKIQKMAAVIETPQGDTIGIRHKMFLSLSYDHRVIDGALGGNFVSKVAAYLEQFDINRNI